MTLLNKTTEMAEMNDNYVTGLYLEDRGTMQNMMLG